CPRDQSILYVLFKGVLIAQHRSDPTLGVLGVGLALCLLGDQDHLPPALRYLKGVGEAREPAPDDQIVAIDSHLFSLSQGRSCRYHSPPRTSRYPEVTRRVSTGGPLLPSTPG